MGRKTAEYLTNSGAPGKCGQADSKRESKQEGVGNTLVCSVSFVNILPSPRPLMSRSRMTTKVVLASSTEGRTSRTSRPRRPLSGLVCGRATSSRTWMAWRSRLDVSRRRSASTRWVAGGSPSASRTCGRRRPRSSSSSVAVVVVICAAAVRRLCRTKERQRRRPRLRRR